MAETIKVLIVDDHAVVRSGLAKILEAESDITVIGEAKNGVEAIEKALTSKPDVILMDIFMPRCSGLEATLAMKQKLPDVRVLILTVSDREEDLFQAIRLGARGYLLKSATITEVADAVRMVAAGEAMLSPSIITRLVAEIQGNNNEPELSARETEVLQLLGKGMANTEIAKLLFIGESTVRTYLRRLLEKLHLNNRAEAIVYAAHHHHIDNRF